MKIHMVKKGESLYSIAQKYNVNLDTLIEANPQIADPNKIDVGMKVKIPSAPAPAESNKPSHHAHKHIVKQGETLWKLSKAWGIPLKALIDANPQLKNPNILLTGQTVYIPKPGGEEKEEKKNTAPIPKGHGEKKSTAPIDLVKEEAEETIPIVFEADVEIEKEEKIVMEKEEKPEPIVVEEPCPPEPCPPEPIVVEEPCAPEPCPPEPCAPEPEIQFTKMEFGEPCEEDDWMPTLPHVELPQMEPMYVEEKFEAEAVYPFNQFQVPATPVVAPYQDQMSDPNLWGGAELPQGWGMQEKQMESYMPGQELHPPYPTALTSSFYPPVYEKDCGCGGKKKMEHGGYWEGYTYPAYGSSTHGHHEYLTHHEKAYDHHIYPGHYGKVYDQHIYPGHHEKVYDQHIYPGHHEKVYDQHIYPEYHEMAYDHHIYPEYHEMAYNHHKYPEYHEMAYDHHHKYPEYHEMAYDHHHKYPGHYEKDYDDHKYPGHHKKDYDDHKYPGHHKKDYDDHKYPKHHKKDYDDHKYPGHHKKDYDDHKYPKHYKKDYDDHKYPKHHKKDYDDHKYPKHYKKGYGDHKYPKHYKKGYDDHKYPKHYKKGYDDHKHPGHHKIVYDHPQYPVHDEYAYDYPQYPSSYPFAAYPFYQPPGFPAFPMDPYGWDMRDYETPPVFDGQEAAYPPAFDAPSFPQLDLEGQEEARIHRYEEGNQDAGSANSQKIENKKARKISNRSKKAANSSSLKKKSGKKPFQDSGRDGMPWINY